MNKISIALPTTSANFLDHLVRQGWNGRDVIQVMIFEAASDWATMPNITFTLAQRIIGALEADYSKESN